MKKCIICGKSLGKEYKWEFQVCDDCIERNKGEPIEDEEKEVEMTVSHKKIYVN